jgi:hypothetical protein
MLSHEVLQRAQKQSATHSLPRQWMKCVMVSRFFRFIPGEIVPGMLIRGWLSLRVDLDVVANGKIHSMTEIQAHSAGLQPVTFLSQLSHLVESLLPLRFVQFQKHVHLTPCILRNFSDTFVMHEL